MERLNNTTIECEQKEHTRFLMELQAKLKSLGDDYHEDID